VRGKKNDTAYQSFARLLKSLNLTKPIAQAAQRNRREGVYSLAPQLPLGHSTGGEGEAQERGVCNGS
jgi:hypothetical protein